MFNVTIINAKGSIKKIFNIIWNYNVFKIYTKFKINRSFQNKFIKQISKLFK